MENSLVKTRRGRNRFSASALEETPYAFKYMQAKVMIDAGKTYAQVHAATGLGTATIAKIVKGEIEIAPTWMKAIKSLESSKLTSLIHQILDAITPEKLETSSATQLTTSAAILIDKRRLLDGESTANVLHADLVSMLSDDRTRLLQQLESLK